MARGIRGGRLERDIPTVVRRMQSSDFSKAANVWLSSWEHRTPRQAMASIGFDDRADQMKMTDLIGALYVSGQLDLEDPDQEIPLPAGEIPALFLHVGWAMYCLGMVYGRDFLKPPVPKFGAGHRLRPDS